MNQSPAPFDHQAASFDDRAGLRPEVRQAVARAIATVVREGSGGLVLEVGAGTGEIGAEIAAGSLDYVGFDLSLPMLEQFRDRRPQGACLVVQADGDRNWPLRDGTASAVFGSRSLHLLEPRHVIDEATRVLGDGGCLLVGRVERDGDGAKDIMRREMRRMLAERGLKGRAGEKNRASLVEGCIDRGATPIEATRVIRWPVEHTARRSIDSWAKKSGMAGITPTEAVKQEILEQLRAFGETTFGGLDVVVRSEESYVIEGARLTD